jgi:hypothetical protein
MGNGIPAPNIFTWDGFRQDHTQWTDAVIPDPGTGSLYGSTVPQQDTQHIYASTADAPIAVPWIPTAFTQLGDTSGFNTWQMDPDDDPDQPDWWAGAPPAQGS